MSRTNAASPRSGPVVIRSSLPWLLAAVLPLAASPTAPQTVANESTAHPAAAGMMMIEGLDAEASMPLDEGNGASFELYSVAFDTAPPAATHSTRAAARTEAPPAQGPGYFTVTRRADALSTALREAIAGRQVFPRAMLTLPASQPGAVPATTVLENLTVVLVRPAARLTFPASGTPGSDGIPIATEQVTFGFERVSTR